MVEAIFEENKAAAYQEEEEEKKEDTSGDAIEAAKLQAFEMIGDLLRAKLGMPEGSEIPEAFMQAIINAQMPKENAKYKKKQVNGPIQVGKALSEWHKRRMI